MKFNVNIKFFIIIVFMLLASCGQSITSDRKYIAIDWKTGEPEQNGTWVVSNGWLIAQGQFKGKMESYSSPVDNCSGFETSFISKMQFFICKATKDFEYQGNKITSGTIYAKEIMSPSGAQWVTISKLKSE